jgi:hypothetical protein
MKIAPFKLIMLISNPYPDKLLGYLLYELDELIKHVTKLTFAHSFLSLTIFFAQGCMC